VHVDCLIVTGSDEIEAESVWLQRYLVKCEPEQVQLGMDSLDGFEQQQQHGASDQRPSVVLACSVPSIVAVTSQALLQSRDPNILYESRDAIAAAARNVTPVKGTSSTIVTVIPRLILYCTLVLMRRK